MTTEMTLDERVAVALNWEVRVAVAPNWEVRSSIITAIMPEGDPDAPTVMDPSPSGSWQGAGMVIEAMRERGYDLVLRTVNVDVLSGGTRPMAYAVFVGAEGEHASLYCTSGQEAICEAALAALEGER